MLWGSGSFGNPGNGGERLSSDVKHPDRVTGVWLKGEQHPAVMSHCRIRWCDIGFFFQNPPMWVQYWTFIGKLINWKSFLHWKTLEKIQRRINKKNKVYCSGGRGHLGTLGMVANGRWMTSIILTEWQGCGSRMIHTTLSWDTPFSVNFGNLQSCSKEVKRSSNYQ